MTPSPESMEAPGGKKQTKKTIEILMKFSQNPTKCIQLDWELVVISVTSTKTTGGNDPKCHQQHKEFTIYKH